MAEATHFLERGVERLDTVALDRAMALYRDRELVAFVLGRASLPSGAERLAFALGEAGAGPFVVVTRGGDFVTCLAEDMDPGDCHVLAREQVDALAGQHAVWQERWRLARELGEGRKAWRKLQQRLFGEGLMASRESFAACAAWHPVVGASWLQQYTDLSMSLVPRLTTALGYLDRRPKRRAQIDGLRDLFRQLFWLGHLAPLLALDPRRMHIRPVGADYGDLTLAQCQLSYPAVMLRTAWMVARFGRLLYPHFRDRLRQATNGIVQFEAIFALLAIGLAHSGLEKDVRRLLRGPSGPSDVWTSPRLPLLLAQRDQFEPLFDARDAAVDRVRTTSQRCMFELMQRREPDLAAQWGDADGVPADIWQPTLLYSDLDYRAGKGQAAAVLDALPLIVRLSAEELYLPEVVVKRMRGEWELSDSLGHLQRFVWIRGPKPEPVRVGERPGRNDACPCGSGRKFKRCCG